MKKTTKKFVIASYIPPPDNIEPTSGEAVKHQQESSTTLPSNSAVGSDTESEEEEEVSEKQGMECRLPPLSDLLKNTCKNQTQNQHQQFLGQQNQHQGGYVMDYGVSSHYGAATAGMPYGGFIVAENYAVSMSAAGGVFSPVLPLHAQRRQFYPPSYIRNLSYSVPGLGMTMASLANSRGNYDYKNPDLLNTNKRKHEFENALSNKRGKKHDSTPVEEYVNWAIKLCNYNLTGIAYKPNKFIILNEDKFYEWVRSIKAPEYALSKSSLLEKFDKSRRTNRVNPKENNGRIPIKFLRIDKVSRNAPPLNNIHEIEQDLEEIQRMYGANHIRVITHRDWGYIDPEYFYYEVPTKKT